jgi:hypothetical protein
MMDSTNVTMGAVLVNNRREGFSGDDLDPILIDKVKYR